MTVGITPTLNWARVNARISYTSLREVIAEFLGTFILLMFAVGGTMNMQALSGWYGGFTLATLAVIPTAFGYFVVTLLFGGVSGAHVNPAVSVGMAIAGRLSWIKLHAFVLAQFLGGYLGSLLAYALYKSHMFRTGGVSDPGASPDPTFPGSVNPASAAMFISTSGAITIGSGFANEIIVTMIFMMCVMAMKDSRPVTTAITTQAGLMLLTVVALGLSFGETTGVAINPVRDFCPRLAALSVGFGAEAVMKGGLDEEWWTVGLFAPFIGAALGSFIYIFVIGAQFKYLEDDDDFGQQVRKDGTSRFVPRNQQHPDQAFSPQISGAHVPHVRSPSPMTPGYQGQMGGRVQFN